jgi:hypothetical protein
VRRQVGKYNIESKQTTSKDRYTLAHACTAYCTRTLSVHV